MLFFKECKKILFSLTFLAYISLLIGFYYVQFYSGISLVSQPKKGSEDYSYTYGYKITDNTEMIMYSAVESLIQEYFDGIFISYPMGIYKEVRLTNNNEKKIENIISEITGISDISYFESNDIKLSDNLTYEEFSEFMRKVDEIIGGGSKYSEELILINFGRVPKSYEDALNEYNKFIYTDKVTGAYARLFCDYIGIIASILPVFVTAEFMNKDKSSKCTDIIYMSKISSLKLIFTRVFSLLFMVILPCIILSLIATFDVSEVYTGYETDKFVITKLSAFWLIPDIMISVSIGMIFNPIISVLINGVLWLGSVMNYGESLTGNIKKFTFVLRHNSIYDRDLFMTSLDDFTFNRIFFTLTSVILILISVFIYDLKRKGSINFEFRKNITCKHKA